MRIRIDIHAESDLRPVECWVTRYGPGGNQEECHSTHDEEVLGRAQALFEALALTHQLTAFDPDPFPE